MRLLLKAYYNRDESLPFLREILVPWLAAAHDRGWIESSFYRRSRARGDHFQLFLRLRSADPEIAAALERQLAQSVARRPSAPPRQLPGLTQFFKSHPNNSVVVGAYEQRDVLTAFEPLKRPLESLFACCASWRLRHLDAAWDPACLALALADGLLEAFRMDLDQRLGCVQQCLELFVPVHLGVGRSRKETSDEVRKLLQTVRRDFGARQAEFEPWLGNAPAPARAWIADLQAQCAPLGAACQTVFGAAAPDAHVADPRASLAGVLLTVFLGLIDLLLLDELEALATASRLQKLYEHRRAGALA